MADIRDMIRRAEAVYDGRLLLNTNPPPDTHFPIIVLLETVTTLHGGYEKWRAACLCGKLNRGKEPGFYIPSQQAAERIYEAHLAQKGPNDLEIESD